MYYNMHAMFYVIVVVFTVATCIYNCKSYTVLVAVNTSYSTARLTVLVCRRNTTTVTVANGPWRI